MQYIYCYFRHGYQDPRLHDDTCHYVVRRNENSRHTKWSRFFSSRQSAEQAMQSEGLEAVPGRCCIDRASRGQSWRSGDC